MSAAFPPFAVGFVLALVAVFVYAANNCADVSSLTQLIGVQGHIMACRVP